METRGSPIDSHHDDRAQPPAAPARVFVALGSNLGDRESHLNRGATDIAGLAGCSDLHCSSIYETAPMGPQDQPDYLNCVCSFFCCMAPHALLAQLQSIERQHGRVRTTQRWTARPLDLDILLFGQRQIDTPELTIPHAGIAQRSFVLWPLAELDDSLQIPGLGDVRQLMDNCETFGIRPYQG